MTITRVSVDSAGDQAIRFSVGSSISADGRFVAFAYGTSLVPAGASGSGDIFVRDLSTNTTTPVSVDSAGNRAMGVGFFPGSFSPSISADGRFVAFESNATNLVPGDTNSYGAIFARDLSTNTTTLVSVDSAGNRGNNYSLSPSISADGRFVAFYSNATNLVPGDNYNFDIFVRDTLANTTTPVSVDSAGDRGNNDSYRPSISADGRFVAFESDATNLVPGDTNNGRDIFVRDTLANTTTRVSVDSAGDRGNSDSYRPSISADGRFVAFESDATNLVPGDTNNRKDIFVRDTLANTTTLVSVSSSGDRAIGFDFFPGSRSPSISPDGRFVAFSSDAINLVPGDTNYYEDIFMRDTIAKTTTLVSVSGAGDRGNGYSLSPSISADGRFVAFYSQAANLVPGDTNNSGDIFVVDLTSTPGGNNNSANVINGTPGNENLTGTPGNDTINGLAGDDVLNGLRGNDIINGGDGSDSLSGGKGFDTLNGGLGDDNLVGGAGNDVFVLGAGLGVDTICDFGNYQDTIQLINGLTFGQLSISPGTNSTLIRVASSGEVLAALTGVAPNFIGPEDFVSV
ncbi:MULTISPECIES: calcium-binding protein [unclassified Microcoleus]|uniref:calcium-binding protein n=1 Tax=unclassified Microcoleus TaxID=2642155 RepID=UPI002FD54149